jgi:S1-C subfamily serine protease
VNFSPFILASLGLLSVTILLQTCSSKPVSQLFSSAEKEGTSQTSIPSLGFEQDSLPVTEIAKQVTVRILTQAASGSGVVIARQGQTYTVLTCQHVVQESKNGRYSVLSADGKTYPARLKSMRSLEDVDLALVQFDSKIPYRVVALGDSHSLSAGTQVYAAGFPNYHFINQNNIEDTQDWGTKAFRLTTGKVSLLLERSLPQGYSLGYTNEVEVGMSGGPVLNQRGEVVGINGRLKYPVQGIEVFTFADGTKPSKELFQQMEALSWAVPIVTFRQLSDVK